MKKIVILVGCFCLAALVSTAFALTTKEVLLLKENGVSEETIRLMIQAETRRQQQSKSSINISEGKTETTYATGQPSSTALTREQQENLERAWEMLKNVSLEIEK